LPGEANEPGAGGDGGTYSAPSESRPAPPIAKWLTDRGFVPLEPYRQAISERVPHGYRRQFGEDLGFTAKRWKSLMSSPRQRSIHRDEANKIALGLEIASLYVDTEPRPANKLLEREIMVWKALKVDPSIHPLDALAFVVWPPEEITNGS
jgi:hypothetical protein